MSGTNYVLLIGSIELPLRPSAADPQCSDTWVNADGKRVKVLFKLWNVEYISRYAKDDDTVVIEGNVTEYGVMVRRVSIATQRGQS